MIRTTTTTLAVLMLTASFEATAQNCSKEVVFEGAAKPSLAVGPDNRPRLAFLLEAQPGFVSYAEKQGGRWVTQQISSGYFYGPIDITVAQGRPAINYHGHDAQDQMVATLQGGTWNVTRINHPGHDGWDNTIAVDGNGRLHTLTTDPADFGGPGLEYASLVNGTWQVEEVGTGPIMYAEGLSMDFDGSNRPHISYHNTGERSLYYGVREDGDWRLVRVDSGPQAGMFSSLELTGDGHPIISYVRLTGGTSAEIRLATFSDGQWNLETIDTVNDLTIGFSFARNATSLELEPSGNPVVAYSGESSIKIATKAGASWQIEVVDEIDNNAGSRFGEQVDLVRDRAGNWHLVSFDVRSPNPLSGAILYYRKSS